MAGVQARMTGRGPRCAADGPRARLALLRRAGLSYTDLARLTGLKADTLMNLANGVGGRQISFVFASTAEALDRVSYRDAASLQISPGSRVDPTSALQQVQSLHAMGWCVEEICAAGEVTAQSLYRLLRGHRITAAVQDEIARIYGCLRLNVPPRHSPLQEKRVRRALQRAKENGWLPGMAEDTWAAAA